MRSLSFPPIRNSLMENGNDYNIILYKHIVQTDHICTLFFLHYLVRISMSHIHSGQEGRMVIIFPLHNNLINWSFDTFS